MGRGILSGLRRLFMMIVEEKKTSSFLFQLFNVTFINHLRIYLYIFLVQFRSSWEHRFILYWSILCIIVSELTKNDNYKFTVNIFILLSVDDYLILPPF